MAFLSERSYEGAILIDHRASPGTAAVPEGTIFESAIRVCNHCQRNVIVNPNRTVPLDKCPKCQMFMCRGCAAVYHRTLECFTIAELLDACEAGHLERVLAKRSLL